MENGQPSGFSCVCVNIYYLRTLNILEYSHCCVLGVLLKHGAVRLALSHIQCWVLEDAALLTKLTFVLQKVFAD